MNYAITKISMEGSHTLIPARYPRIEGTSSNVSEHHTSRSNWFTVRTAVGNEGVVQIKADFKHKL